MAETLRLLVKRIFIGAELLVIPADKPESRRQSPPTTGTFEGRLRRGNLKSLLFNQMYFLRTSEKMWP